jgi:integrase
MSAGVLLCHVGKLWVEMLIGRYGTAESFMAKAIGRLSTLTISRAKPGMHPDGRGLYLQVSGPSARSWVFRYTINGRTHYLGLGSAYTIDLKRAREDARRAREMVHDGIDPIEHRKTKRMQQRLDAVKAMTFDECAEAYIAAHDPSWSNPKHRQQWRNTLRDYASPVFGDLAVSAVDTGLVLKVLEPLWTSRPETASRLRGRIESVLDLAKVRGLRDGENPARWKGHLDHLLPARSKVRKVQHHAALPYGEINALVTLLRAQKGITPRALEFAILTAARTGEVLGAKWSEIDTAAAMWTIPAGRMKGGREHRIPLCDRALAIIEEMHGHDRELVFPLSEKAMSMLLRRIGRNDVTVHGFRSTFRDWAGEVTSFPNHVVEMALAHTIPSAVEAAYRRGDLLEKRRRLMTEWARYCETQRTANGATPIRKVK